MTWTTELPTEPGAYWVSIDPGMRTPNGRDSEPVREVTIERRKPRFSKLSQPAFLYCADGRMDALPPHFRGAKWAKREVPADPWVTP